MDPHCPPKPPRSLAWYCRVTGITLDGYRIASVHLIAIKFNYNVIFNYRKEVAINIVGQDICYSNIKIAYGTAEQGMKTAIRPAGAAPADRFGGRFDGKAQDDFLHVLVNDQPFIAGVSSDRAEMWERSLHADYSSTESYKALFHAGLLMTGMTEIDVLVTGLPVSQFQDERRRKALEAQFTGKHKVTPKRTVEVKSVKVVAQPIGGLFDMLNQDDEAGDDAVIDEEARILVVDPGFFSLDWVLISDGEYHRRSSNTSLQASSVLLEQAGILIAQEYGAKPTVEALENAVRAGKTSILLMGQRVDFQPYLKRASQELSSVIANSIQKSLRSEQMSPDIVVLTGGGADFFRETIQDAFPRLKVISPNEPVLSNARGFWLMGSVA